MASLRLDKYARDIRAWRDFAKLNYISAVTLFDTNNPFLFFAAATLGHQALEMYLKAALIQAGMTAFDPGKLRSLDPAIGLQRDDCVWGHNLSSLARKLAEKRSDFDLAEMIVVRAVILKMPMTLAEAFRLFDPFFFELRYPQELKQMEGLGDEERLVLDELVKRLVASLGNLTLPSPDIGS
jgi:hypothetical protein